MAMAKGTSQSVSKKEFDKILSKKEKLVEIITQKDSEIDELVQSNKDLKKEMEGFKNENERKKVVIEQTISKMESEHQMQIDEIVSGMKE
jgi:uncharacterized protein YoxC